LIYSLDETGNQTKHRPSLVITGVSASKAQTVTSPNTGTSTIIAWVNGADTAIPPYNVFTEKGLNDNLMTNAVDGAGYALSFPEICIVGIRRQQWTRIVDL